MVDSNWIVQISLFLKSFSDKGFGWSGNIDPDVPRAVL